MTWVLERYERDDRESPVEDFLTTLPTKVRAKVWAHLTHLQDIGNRAAAPISKSLGEGLFELRVSARRHEVRILYAFFPGQRIILLHGFLKKTQAIPARDLETARARLRELRENCAMARSAPFRRRLNDELRDPKFAAEYDAELARLRIAEQLAAARQEQHLSQQELAHRMDTAQPTVARLERGDYGGYTVRTLAKVARALGRRLRIELEPAPRSVAVSKKVVARHMAKKK